MTGSRAAALAAIAAAGAAGCRERAPQAIAGRFSDAFERTDPGPDWRNTGGPYRIESGRLKVSHAYNHPLWLRRALPRDVEIRFAATPRSPSGDVKVEVFGDGRSHARDKGGYTATGYLLIHGGWRNSVTVLARLDEHGGDRLARTDLLPEPGRAYRWRIRREGSTLSWWIDGVQVFELDDPEPLSGEGHAHFAFNDWESEVLFDDLEIEAL